MKISVLSKLENIVNSLLSKVSTPTALSNLKFSKSTIVPVTSPIEITEGTSEQKEEARNRSRLDSQGVSGFSGSGYNGKGKVDNGKIRSNKKRR